ncbi:hypothetical protein EVG20_g5604 [Dentipellis fragilis]|uniref:BOD1/SHG1 domain-containing protein n=1 Tax=Dentipellis fragilis TaxID=205917 RepID=A0A4Y9YTC2_9AGAM|nr:hypothetical protein EVG20_g5604 [Dentipellis fragilis]
MTWFKQSGEFTRLRRDLLAQFQNSDGMGAFMARVEDVVQKRLDLEHNKLQFMPQDYVHRELLQELDRYPIVERAMGDFHAKTGADMSSQIRKALQKALRKDRGVAEKDDDEEEAEEAGESEAGKDKGKKSSPMASERASGSPMAIDRSRSNSREPVSGAATPAEPTDSTSVTNGRSDAPPSEMT